MELTDAERLYDDCPPRFDAGMVVMKPFTLYALYDGSAFALQPHMAFVAFVATILAVLFTK